MSRRLLTVKKRNHYFIGLSLSDRYAGTLDNSHDHSTVVIQHLAFHPGGNSHIETSLSEPALASVSSSRYTLCNLEPCTARDSGKHQCLLLGTAETGVAQSLDQHSMGEWMKSAGTGFMLLGGFDTRSVELDNRAAVDTVEMIVMFAEMEMFIPDISFPEYFRHCKSECYKMVKSVPDLLV